MIRRARPANRPWSRGFSAAEILVVIAIIGVLSLVTVPAFINLQRRSAVRSGLRSFTSDLRGYRQLAITKNRWVRVQFTGNRSYVGKQSNDLGATWQDLQVGTVVETVQAQPERSLPETLVINANTFNDSDADGKPDIDFRPDGTVGDFNGNTATGGSITLRTDWKDILNTVVIEISTSGQFKTTESKS